MHFTTGRQCTWIGGEIRFELWLRVGNLFQWARVSSYVKASQKYICARLFQGLTLAGRCISGIQRVIWQILNIESSSIHC